MASIYWESPMVCYVFQGDRIADFLLRKEAGRKCSKLTFFEPPVMLEEPDLGALARFLNPKTIRISRLRELRDFIGFKAWGGQRSELEAVVKFPEEDGHKSD